MILGKIIGKVATMNFEFVSTSSQTRKYQFIQVNHIEYGFVLAQVVEMVRTEQQLIAQCTVIGYKDEQGIVRGMRSPFQVGSEVLEAEDSLVEEIVKISGEGAFIGKLEGKGIRVRLDLQKVLTRHVCVLAKSGAGKSYTVGVLVEEIMERGIPLIVIDPHGEYGSLKWPSKERERLMRWDLQPRGYSEMLQEYGDIGINQEVRPLKLDEKMSCYELMKILPISLSQTQEAVLFSVVKGLEQINFDNIILGLEQISSAAKWNIIDTLLYLRNLRIFSSAPTPLNELVRPGRGTIISLRGITPDIQDIIVYRLLRDLFLARKQSKIAPFFCVIEEAHNFCPERGVGRTKSLEVVRLISSEGRKFGMGLCIVSQRPALIQKSILSQCSTQIVMKITNPNDLRAVTASLEGITPETENEIQNLRVGSAMICGIVDRPLSVEIRPRKSQHGGNAVNMLAMVQAEDNTRPGGQENRPEMVNGDTDNNKHPRDIDSSNPQQAVTLQPDKVEIKEENWHEDREEYPQPAAEWSKMDDFSGTGLLIMPKMGLDDIRLASTREVKKVVTYRIPAVMAEVKINNERFSVLIDRVKGKIILDPDEDIKMEIKDISASSQFLRRPRYENLKCDATIDPKMDASALIEELGKYCTVKDYQGCDIIYHKVEYIK